MNTQTSSLSKWFLCVLPNEQIDLIFRAIAAIANKNDHVTVLDCGRQYNALAVARNACGKKEIVDRIEARRAFTCHEVVLLIKKASKEKRPLFVLNPLATFQDENVKLSTRKYLLEKMIDTYEEISLKSYLFATTPEIPMSSNFFPFFRRLVISCPVPFAYKMHDPKPQQKELPSWGI